MSIFDTLLSCVAVEEEPGLEDPEQAKQAILELLQPGKYAPSALTQRVLDPIYELPPLTEDCQKSAPFSLQYKSDVNTKKGIVTAYLTTYLDLDGKPYIDPYNDIIHDTAFVDTVRHLEAQRKRKGSDWLVPDLYQHDRKEHIGGIKGIALDSRGPIYEAHLFLGIQRARDVLELCERKACGSSFGYDPVDFEHDQKGIRHLRALTLHEISQVTFAANNLAPILDVKSRFYVPSSYPVKQPAQGDWRKIKADLKKADALFDQLIQQGIQAYQQYRWEHR